MRLPVLFVTGLIVTGLIAGSTLLVATPATAAPTCHGLTATIVGTSGADDRTGTDGADVVSLGDGDDHFSGLGGNDVVCSGGGDDEVYGGPGADRLYGDAGYDYLFPGAGDDHVFGGPNYDRVRYDDATHGVRIDVASDTATGAGHDAFDSIEEYLGSSYADLLIGTPGRDVLNGGFGGDDRIHGYGGADDLTAGSGTVWAGPGNDNVMVGDSAVAHLGPGMDHGSSYAGSPTLYGEDGEDTFDAFETSTPYLHGGAGGDAVLLTFREHGAVVDVAAHTGDVRVWSVLQVYGSEFADVIKGDGGHNEIFGRQGPDQLYGRGGPDAIDGEEGRDRGDGGAGADSCRNVEVQISC
jgi:Ca2+-binding RTX toxin-like protein